MPDAITATLNLMWVPREQTTNRTGYNIQGLSVTPSEMERSIQRFCPEFKVYYQIDGRQSIAEGWPKVVDETVAQRDWQWQSKYDLDYMTEDMLTHLIKREKGI